MNKRKQIIEVVAYNPEWIKQYQAEAELISSIFSDNFSAIHHIGSTAIPGMMAKPVIDIILIVKNIDSVDLKNEAMSNLAYEAWGEYHIPGRRFFVKGDEKRTHHVHAFQEGSAAIEKHLAFRDYMICHPQEAEKYAALKVELAKKFRFNRRAYVLGKEAYVKRINDIAIKYFSSKKS